MPTGLTELRELRANPYQFQSHNHHAEILPGHSTQCSPVRLLSVHLFAGNPAPGLLAAICCPHSSRTAGLVAPSVQIPTGTAAPPVRRLSSTVLYSHALSSCVSVLAVGGGPCACGPSCPSYVCCSGGRTSRGSTRSASRRRSRAGSDGTAGGPPPRSGRPSSRSDTDTG